VTVPLRVLQVVRPAQGGIRQHVLTLLDGFDPSVISCAVAAPSAFVRETLLHPQVAATIPLDIAARFSPARDFLAARRLAHVIPKFADVVHAHGARAGWVCALAHRHHPFPLIFTAHNLVRADLSARLGMPFIGFHSDRIIAVSPSVENSLAACGVSRSKIQVIPNGIDLSHFSPISAEARATARKVFGVPENAFVIAAAGRLSREKGMDTLLLAAAQRTGMTFLMAGDGPQKATLRSHCPANAKLLGRLDDILPLLSAADIFAVPSRREGQGIAALEAMAAGVPIVASRVGGLADMLADGESALLVPPNDPDALAAAFSRLRSDTRLRGKLAENAMPIVRERYEVSQMLSALAAVYWEEYLG